MKAPIMNSVLAPEKDMRSQQLHTLDAYTQDTLSYALELLLENDDFSQFMEALAPRLQHFCPALTWVSFYQHHEDNVSRPDEPSDGLRNYNSHGFSELREHQHIPDSPERFAVGTDFLLNHPYPVYVMRTFDPALAKNTSALYIPLRFRSHEGQAWGLLEWLADETDAFSLEARHFFVELQSSVELLLLRLQYRQKLDWQLTHMQVLTAAHQALRSVQTPLEVLAQTLVSAVRETSADLGKIFIYDEERDKLVLRAQRYQGQYSYSSAQSEHSSADSDEKFDKTLTDTSEKAAAQPLNYLRYATAVHMNNTVQHWRFLDNESTSKDLNQIQKSQNSEQLLDLWGLPLRNERGQARGVVIVGAETSYFSQHDMAFLEVLTEVCSEALLRQELLETAEQRARDYRKLYHNAERRSRELSLLERVRSAVSLALTPHDVFKSVVDTIVSAFGYSAVMIFTAHPDGKHMILRYQHGYDSQRIQLHEGETLPLGRGVVGKVMRKGKATLVSDPEDEANFYHLIPDIKSEMVVPFHYDHGTRGVFCIESGEHHFDGQDLELLIAVAEHVSISLERAHLYSRLQASEAQFRGIFEQNTQFMSLLDTRGRVVDSNKAAQGIFKRLSGTKAVSAYEAMKGAAEEHQFRELRSYISQAIKGKAVTYETSLFDAENNEVDLEIRISPIFDNENQVQMILAAAQDLSALHRYSRELEISESRLRLLAEHMSDLVALHDHSGGFLYISPSCQELLGYSPEWLMGHSLQSLIHPNDQERLLNEGMKLMQENDHITLPAYRIRCSDGSYIWFETYIRQIRNEYGKTRQFVTTSRDISSRKAIEEELRLSAHYDGLTGLPNRLKLLEELDAALRPSNKATRPPFSLLFIDLDRFKVVNDSLGHNVGDDLLRAIAQRLQNCVDIHHTVARLGGDEFAILLLDQDVEQAKYTARCILDVMAHPFNLQGREVYSGCSIGIAGSHERYNDAQDLLRDADLTMYQIKQRGGGSFTVFNQALHQAALRRLRLETDMRRALGSEQFTLMYQPIIDLRIGNVIGFEALMRWTHPELGAISPQEFIIIAEETGIILDLGEWLMEQVCAQISAWSKRYSQQLTVGVNISAKQFTLSDMVAQTKKVISYYGVLPQQIKLEITESALLEDSQAIIQSLTALRALGIRIHIDDFGTGYSSLAYLQRLPIDALKIDKRFVMNIDKDKEGETNKQLVRTIIAMAQGLGIEIIAEGVETAGQARYLDTVGAHYGQGFYFSQPLSSADGERLLQRENSKGKVILPLKP